MDQRLGVIGEPVDPVAEVEDADSVDPTAEVGRRRDVGADRHDMLGDIGHVVSEVDEEATERLLGRGKAAVRASEFFDDRRRVAAGMFAPRQSLGGVAAQPGLGAVLGEQSPRIVAVGAEVMRQRLPLVGR